MPQVSSYLWDEMSMPNAKGWGARYHCPECGLVWTGYTGPNDCPGCLNFLLIVWGNYEEMAARRFRGYLTTPPLIEKDI